MGTKVYLSDSMIQVYNNEGSVEKKVLYFLAAEPVEITPPQEMCVVMVYPYEWSLMMTPWKYSGSGVRGMEATGGGKEYAEGFQREVMENAESLFGFHVTGRGIAGYSLGGIEALYMASINHDFGNFEFAGSVSGSFWYEGAVQYFGGHDLQGVHKAYVSIGSKETGKAGTERAMVRANTEELVRILREKIDVTYEINQGGHFSDIQERMEKCANCWKNVEKVI